MKQHHIAIAALLLSGLLNADDIATPTTGTPDITPFLMPSLEEKYSAEAAKADAISTKAEAEAAKVKRIAAEARLKGYKSKLTEITKAGDFDKAQQVKARITQLENEPEAESHKPGKRPRPKDTVKFGGHVYALIKEPATWHMAKQRCEEMGGHLVCIETEAEDAFVRALCGQTTTWAGGSDEETEGRWIWVHKNNPVKLMITIDNAGDLDHHLALFDGDWYDGRAGNRYAYVCEWE